MNKFSFQGAISASKSIFNRALTIQSFEPGITLEGTSTCDDVVLMQKATEQLRQGAKTFDCGHAGTVFRFLALRLSREPGTWTLTASPRLLSRPQAGLLKIFDQLGVSYRASPAGLQIVSRGWVPRTEIFVEGSESSQFLSSLVLNSWNLSVPLAITLQGTLVSRGYFDLTEKLVKHFGMRLHQTMNGGWLVPAQQKPQARHFLVEPDMSSCFAIAACAVFSGSCVINNFPADSWQPDAVFRDLLKMMNVEWLQEDHTLQVRETPTLSAMNVDVNNNPDVVPVLAVLLARASGPSRLRGFGHLIHKESNRLVQVQKLLTSLGRTWKLEGDELVINGDPAPFHATGSFDPDQDHRMAMAAQVANFGGATFKILHKDVVAKSFPEFWEIVGPSC